MADLLVYCERQDVAVELVAKSRELAADLGLRPSAAALGPGAAAMGAALGAAGAERVYVSEDAALEGWPVDTVAKALAQIAHQAEATVVMVGSTRRGKELAPLLAEKLGAGCVSDVNQMAVEDGRLVAGRYAYGGNTIAREVVDTPLQVFAVMPKTFAVETVEAGAGEIVAPALQLTPSAVKVIERRAREGETVDLTAAQRIVGVGRGFGKREDLPLGEQLATALEAELACTKSLADFGWLPEDRIVGLSGAKTAPDLYVAAGVSGQIQHTVGISAAKLIVAVNKDKEAPIFALADYGIVGDLYEVIPALVERLATVS